MTPIRLGRASQHQASAPHSTSSGKTHSPVPATSLYPYAPTGIQLRQGSSQSKHRIGLALAHRLPCLPPPHLTTPMRETTPCLGHPASSHPSTSSACISLSRTRYYA
ncbi:hypothetical protein LX36DRAFT_280640 [Colletotrichum falcatum]|nr:hypothetical protein LX36DRAFT_280640 [Colletotrichum falcatum]